MQAFLRELRLREITVSSFLGSGGLRWNGGPPAGGGHAFQVDGFISWLQLTVQLTFDLRRGDLGVLERDDLSAISSTGAVTSAPEQRRSSRLMSSAACTGSAAARSGHGRSRHVQNRAHFYPLKTRFGSISFSAVLHHQLLAGPPSWSSKTPVL